MIEITSKKTGKIQIVTNDQWLAIIEKGWAARFTIKPIAERKLKDVPIIPPEIKTKTTKIK
ncbi:MAG TPA: hypothetical protein VFC41_09975 [Anaerovoracaceae bacterium]|nr:hypothetical protein [Anaerovoracaceae bacterium]